MSKAIPDRWTHYTPVGKIIEGTRFVAFKVPLREEVSSRVTQDKQLSLYDLVEKLPNLGLIIDLTNTRRYYDPKFFEERGIKHLQISVPGHNVPPYPLVEKFKLTVSSFLKERNDKIIGVHCTHGVNRTGFMICNYMISEMHMSPSDAIARFAKARGYPIERDNYLGNLYKVGGIDPKSSSSKSEDSMQQAVNSLQNLRISSVKAPPKKN